MFHVTNVLLWVRNPIFKFILDVRVSMYVTFVKNYICIYDNSIDLYSETTTVKLLQNE